MKGRWSIRLMCEVLQVSASGYFRWDASRRDSAPTESLWGRLKPACVHGQRFATRMQARQAVMDWIAFYNHSRLHSALGYLSPMQFEQRWLAAQRKSAA